MAVMPLATDIMQTVVCPLPGTGALAGAAQPPQRSATGLPSDAHRHRPSAELLLDAVVLLERLRPRIRSHRPRSLGSGTCHRAPKLSHSLAQNHLFSVLLRRQEPRAHGQCISALGSCFRESTRLCKPIHTPRSGSSPASASTTLVIAVKSASGPTSLSTRARRSRT